MKTILIAIDESAYSVKALKTGLDIAHDLKARAAIMHVVDTALITSDAGYTPRELMHTMKMEAATFMEKITETFNCEDALTFIEEGKPSEKIIEIAQVLNVHYIVIGTHGRTGLNRMLTGSVAEDVLRHSTIPVIIVPFKSLNKT